MSNLSIFCVLFLLIAVNFATTLSSESTQTSNDGKRKPVTPLELYRGLLRQKRAAHKEAVEAILGMMENYEKQYKMVKMLYTKIFKVLEESRVNVERLGFLPGDDFPEKEEVRDAVSLLGENTLFLGELALHLPAISEDLMKRREHQQWDGLLRWAVGFCNDTSFFDTGDKKLLHLMAQEMNVIEKEESFVNPYKQENVEEIIENEVEKLLKKTLKKEEKKKQRKKNRGPRLTGGRTEL